MAFRFRAHLLCLRKDHALSSSLKTPDLPNAQLTGWSLVATFSGVLLIPKGEVPVLTRYYENAPKIVPNYSRKRGDFSCTLMSERFTGHIIERRAE